MKAFFLLLFACSIQLAGAQAPNTQWLRTAGGFVQYTPYFSVANGHGFIYTAGTGSGMDFGGGVSVAVTGPAIACYTTDGDVVWARALTTTIGEVATIVAITTNSAGDLWVAGNFTTPGLTIDGHLLANTGASSAYVARFDVNGDAQFSVAWGNSGPTSTVTTDISTDATDRVLISGHSDAGMLVFGPGINVVNSAGGEQVVTLVLDATGAAVWASMSAAPDGGAWGLCITADASGNVYLAARFNESLVIDGETLTTANMGDVALVKYTSDGSVDWMHPVAVCDPLDLTADDEGNTYLCGDFQAEANFDGTILTPSVLDGFVSAYDPGGDFRWVTAVQGDIDNELCESVVLDTTQTNVVVGGTFVISATFGGVSVQTGTSPTDGFVMLLDTSGGVGWVKDMTGDGPTLFAQACFDEEGHLFASGTTQSLTTYLGEPVLNANGNQAFLARFEDLTTGIPSLANDAAIQANPNPSHGTFTIDLPADARMITISDALGRVQQRVPVTTNIASLKIDAPGVYFVTVFTPTTQQVERVVVE